MPESLSQAIRERLNYGAERKVYIRADTRAHFGTVKKTLDAVRAAGMEQVVFLVDRAPPVSSLSQSKR